MSRTITNKFNLPGPMFRALAANTYVGGGDISATRLISPPRIVVLRKYHEDEIEEDASDRIWSLLGSSVHRMLELSADESSKVEERLSMPVAGILKPDGTEWIWKVTAQPDVYENKTLYDYKVTSIWSVLFGEKPEWTNQVNIQAALHRYNGDEVEEGNIVAVMRDWQNSKARYEKDYPKSAVMKISIPIWSFEDQKAYIIRRVKLHQTAEKKFLDSGKDPESLPLCTPDERWLRGESWAAKYMDQKTGAINKNAKRRFDNKTDALQFMSDNQPTTKNKIWAPIEHKEGENIRCLNYCDVADFCPFGKKLLADREAKAMALLNQPIVNEGSEGELPLED